MFSDKIMRQTVLKAQIAELEKELGGVMAEIKAELADKISAAYAEKSNDGPFGTVHVEHEGYRFKITTPKNVKWDETKLASIAEKIKAAGDNPDDYIKTELSVSEAAYKNWPSSITEIFEPARTVKPGTTKIELEE